SQPEFPRTHSHGQSQKERSSSTSPTRKRRADYGAALQLKRSTMVQRVIDFAMRKLSRSRSEKPLKKCSKSSLLSRNNNPHLLLTVKTNSYFKTCGPIESHPRHEVEVCDLLRGFETRI